MRLLYSRQLDGIVAEWWNTVDPVYKKAFFFIFGVNLLAFGFEMSNLTLHHDDVSFIFIQSTILGHYLGRFGLGWLYYYTQNAYYMPFLQMLQGVVIMTAYGMMISRFWGLRSTLDIVLVSSILCIFPYMAQLYTYNIIMVALPVAHFLAAAAVVLSARATVASVAVASLLYVGAFSIYQSVAANAATVFIVWATSILLFGKDTAGQFLRKMARPTAAVLVSVVTGGLLYIAIVALMNIDFDSYQNAGEAFNLKDGLNLSYVATEMLNGTRAFLAWPENYFPLYLKRLQLALIVIAGLFCLWFPKGPVKKLSAVAMLVLVLVTPRILQIVHPQGNFHEGTLTAYAIAVAGCVMILLRARTILVKNISAILAICILAGYLVQCNWISTVNYLNTLAHYTTFTQILTRVKLLPREHWDGKKVAVVGNYRMYSGHPYKIATGVATTYIDTLHAKRLARIMRENISILEADEITPEVQEYAKKRSPWPHPDGVSVFGDIAVVVLSNDDLEQGTPGTDGDTSKPEPGYSRLDTE
jgi:hypothetical protein